MVKKARRADVELVAVDVTEVGHAVVGCRSICDEVVVAGAAVSERAGGGGGTMTAAG